MFGAYFGLFFAAFGAATLLPLQSEAVLVGLLLSDEYWLWSLLAVATLGNVLGSLVNWWLGRGLERFRDRRWFPVSPSHLEQARKHYQRYGHWSLLRRLPVFNAALIMPIQHRPVSYGVHLCPLPSPAGCPAFC
jgi:membrane protein YqaA with SNARE-associated domain